MGQGRTGVMNPHVLGAIFAVVAYLIGSLPFGFLVARLVGKVDIRTVGSGNIGATNVGRVLGFRWFLVVFALDFCKGLLPAWLFPIAVERLTGMPARESGVLVALASIVGHNYPIFLKFRGGKGVATSLGAMCALDFVSSAAAATAFVVFLIVTRYVSLSSVLGGLAFLGVYFMHVKDPWGVDHVAFTVLILCLFALLLYRHRANFGRIAAGTEPKVSFRRSRSARPSGFTTIRIVFWLATLGGAAAFVSARVALRSECVVAGVRFVEVGKVSTGHQRAERVVFCDAGRKVAVACPRYNRVVLYKVDRASGFQLDHDVVFDGRPVALATTSDRIYVLARPLADARHLETGWLEAIDFDGRPVGSKVRVGFDPDDIAVSDDGRHLLVLTSGSAEGETNRPAPALEILDRATMRVVGSLKFEGPRDDPARILLERGAPRAAITIRGSDEVARVDLSDVAHPRIVSRAPLPPEEALLEADSNAALTTPLIVHPEREAAGVRCGPNLAAFLVETLPHGSGIAIKPLTPGTKRTILTLRGAFNFGPIRPTGLDWSPERGLIVVSDRAGGAHLIAAGLDADPPLRAAAR